MTSGLLDRVFAEGCVWGPIVPTNKSEPLVTCRRWEQTSVPIHRDEWLLLK